MKNFLTGLPVGIAAALGALPFAAPSLALEPVNSNAPKSSQLSQVTNDLPAISGDRALSQVTSVSQLSDVKPTDWAFTALQSLVERYGCIAGYPDRTYRGQRALSRYEFAAGLNACLDKVNEILASGLADKVSKADLAALQKLQEEFASELAALKGRVDALDAKTAKLEAQQFSTTTKLNAEVLTYLAAASSPNNSTLGYRVRLNFDTSFTGSDRLRTRLQATNLRSFLVGNEGNRFASDETRFLPTAVNQNGDFRLNTLTYSFNAAPNLRLHLVASTADPAVFADPVSPFNDFATGALSNFMNSNPIYYPIGNRAGLAATYTFNDNFVFDAGYLGEDTNGIGSPSNPGPGSGIFSGGNSAYAQLTYYAPAVTLALTYVRAYSVENGADTLTGSTATKFLGVGPTTSNNYGVQALWKAAKNFQIGGWAGLTEASATNGLGGASMFNYAVQFAFPDLFGEGNMLGLAFGQQPRVTSTTNPVIATAIGLPSGLRSDRDTGYHIEAFYRWRLNKNISVTPGFFWLTAPNHDSRNPGVVIGVVRTSFEF